MSTAFVLKRRTNCNDFDKGDVYALNALYKTCDDFTRFVTKHSIKNYLVSTCSRLFRFIKYYNIRIDDSNKVVIFE